MKIKLLMGIMVILMASCAAPQPAASQVAMAAAAAVPTATSARVAQLTPTAAAQATATELPTVAPSATATSIPAVTAEPSPTTTAAAVASAKPQSATTTNGNGSGVLLPLNARKYSAPTLLTPNNNAIYHVAQPVVQIAWSETPTDLMTFGQTAGCVSDATNFRRAFESYQLVIHSLDAPRADQVQWTENSTEFDLNLTTVPQGRYSWSVNVVTVCESYVVGQRNKTITRSLLGAVSPTSATRAITWIP
jgi:hypothetical protein